MRRGRPGQWGAPSAGQRLGLELCVRSASQTQVRPLQGPVGVTPGTRWPAATSPGGAGCAGLRMDRSTVPGRRTGPGRRAQHTGRPRGAQFTGRKFCLHVAVLPKPQGGGTCNVRSSQANTPHSSPLVTFKGQCWRLRLLWTPPGALAPVEDGHRGCHGPGTGCVRPLTGVQESPGWTLPRGPEEV